MLAQPSLVAPCARCGLLRRFESAGRFRVNAQRRRLDVWLLYRCRSCEATAKRRLHRRLPVAGLAPERLAAYLSDDPELARAHAFELPISEPLPYRVERPRLAGASEIHARIVQPHPCGVRWDRFLARELGWPRARVLRAWRAGAVRLQGGGGLARPIADGDEVSVAW